MTRRRQRLLPGTALRFRRLSMAPPTNKRKTEMFFPGGLDLFPPAGRCRFPGPKKRFLFRCLSRKLHQATVAASHTILTKPG